KVTVQETWPRVFMTRRRKKDGAKYFGPYASSAAMWASLKLITTLFPLRKCKGSNPPTRKRPCLNYQLGNCLAPCVGLASPETYREHLENVLLVLEGRNKNLITRLKQNMTDAAARQDFETAAMLRDQLQALEKTLEKQLVASQNTTDQDVFGCHRQGAAVAISLLFVRDGLISGSRSFFFEDPYGDDASIVHQIINQYYDQDSFIPQEILLPLEPEEQELTTEHLRDLAKKQVHLIIPQRGNKKALVNMAATNAAQLFAKREKKEQGWQALAKTMSQNLHLDRQPTTIECVDISNTSGKKAVGALVCFQNGEPSPSRYRHYHIKTVDGPNDYAMMREVLTRRLTRGIEENNLPDLFVVDGGKGQLAIATSVARDLGVFADIDWIGIAKERAEEGEKLYRPGRKNPILLKAHSPVLLYLMRIRDESHRYGITFHRRLRTKANFCSELDTIPGIGNARKHLLLKHFGSIKRLKAATKEEIIAVPGIGKELANIIFTTLETASATNE
ncbi:MAG: excinuclease ABC subunit C, partial [Acidobacteria bacterium]